MTGKLRYRPEIDGLRSVAVLPVMVFHAGFGVFSGGYVGVDVFFVISGFLITSIIYRDVERGCFSYADFYERRARRIFPALYSMLLVSFVGAWLFLVPGDFVDYSKSLISVVGFVSNIEFWRQSDYFSPASDLKPLLHTWSLAVEEQYYLFFPVLLLLLVRFFRRHVLAALVLVSIVSLWLANWGATHAPTANYYLLPTRGWELAMGSALAVAQRRYPRVLVAESNGPTANLLSALGLALILYAVIFFDGDTPFPSLWALIPTGGTALVIAFCTQGTWTQRLLSTKPLVGIGLVSYSAYLWHQPIFAFARQQSFTAPSGPLMFCGLLLALAIAFVSWKYVESPFRNRTATSRRLIWWSSLAVGATIILVGAVGVAFDGFPERFRLQEPLTEENFQLAKVENGWCFYNVDSNPKLEVGRAGQSCVLGDADAPTRALLFGDSLAGMYEPFWDAVGKAAHLSIRSLTTNWCYPSLTKNYTATTDTRAYDQCLMNRKLVEEQLSSFDLMIVAGAWTMVEKESRLPEVISLVRRAAEAAGVKVVVMAQPPTFSRSSVMHAVFSRGDLKRWENDPIAQRANEKLARVAEEYANVHFVSREQLFRAGPSSSMERTAAGVPYSLDGYHISIYGSTVAAANFMANDSFARLQRFLQ